MESKSKVGNIAKSAMGLSLISGITLIFSFLKESVFAYYFGTTAIADAYAIAIQLPVTLFSVVSTAISTIVIPNYSKELIQNGKEKARKFVSNLITIITILTIALLVILELAAPIVIKITAPGLVKETSDVACLLFRMVMPTVLLTELVNINTGILNVHKSFELPALGSMFLNLLYVTVVIVLANSIGIYAAIVGYIIGTFVQFAYSLILRIHFVKYEFGINIKDETIVGSFKMAIPVFIGIGAAEINKVIDKMVSSFLQEGSIASLNYASKLSGAVATLLISGITTVVYPEFSRCVNEKRYKDLADNFLLSLKMYVVIVLPLIMGGTFLSTEIITIVFKRGTFDAESVAKTAPIFACYLTCLLFTAIRQSSSRLFYSYNDSKTPMKNSLIGIGCNIVLNIILAHFLQAFGLALATTISTAIISALILKDAKNKNEYIQYRKILLLVGKATLSSVVMLLMLYGIKISGIFSGFGNDSIGYQIVYLGASIVVGVLIYVIMLLITGTEEAHIVFRKVLERK